jgi:Zn-dependent protease with chaperone function
VLVVLPWWLADQQTQDGWVVVVLGYVALIIGVVLWEQHRVRRWWPMVNELLADVLVHTPQLQPDQVRLQQSKMPLPGATSTLLTDGATRITICDGLRVLYGDPDAVWFVLAHEVAHQVLGHLHTPPDTPAAQQALRQRYELEADAWAVVLAIQAGRDPRTGIRSLERLGKIEAAALAGRARPDTHPEGAARVAAMKAQLADLGSTG